MRDVCFESYSRQFMPHKHFGSTEEQNDDRLHTQSL